MLTSEHAKILTFIYGPMTSNRIEQLKNDPRSIARISGFWNVFLGLSDYLLLDVPVLNEKEMLHFLEQIISINKSVQRYRQKKLSSQTLSHLYRIVCTRMM